MNPIVTIQLPGLGLAQGETIEPADERGFVRADMHGNVAIRDGATVWVGKPVPKIRNEGQSWQNVNGH